jgi:uncharacterized protein with HEPN domain
VSRSDTERLRDILDSIDAIARADATLRRYPDDADVALAALDAVQYRVMAIGEAVKALSVSLRGAHPEVPWSDIARMRDLIGHHYYKLDPQIVRATIAEPVARLRAACEAMLVERSGTIDRPD